MGFLNFMYDYDEARIHD